MRFDPQRSLAGAAVAGALLLALTSPAPSQGQVAVPGSGTTEVPTTGSGCVEGLRGAADRSTCILASNTPQLGRLFTLSRDFFVHPQSSFVGIGTVFLTRKLEVAGPVAVSAPPGVLKVALRSSNDQSFGIVETISTQPASGFPVVTNLISTTSADPASGALATVRLGTQFLVALTTSATNSAAGYVSVRNANVEVAGIDGNTGTVFGTSKSFVQPHPTDATKEIQYVSLEGPEHGIYHRGTARLVDGRAVLHLPEGFRLVAREDGLTVNLTPLEPSRGLYVESKGRAGVVVRENPGGSGDAAFDFLVMGVRAALPDHVAICENVHFAPRPGTAFAPDRLPAGYRELLIRNGTLDA